MAAHLGGYPQAGESRRQRLAERQPGRGHQPGQVHGGRVAVDLTEAVDQQLTAAQRQPGLDPARFEQGQGPVLRARGHVHHPVPRLESAADHGGGEPLALVLILVQRAQVLAGHQRARDPPAAARTAAAPPGRRRRSADPLRSGRGSRPAMVRDWATPHARAPRALNVAPSLPGLPRPCPGPPRVRTRPEVHPGPRGYRYRDLATPVSQPARASRPDRVQARRVRQRHRERPVSVESGSSVLRSHRHVVQFYDRDEELAESAGDYLADAIAEGGAAVIVATPARCAVFEARLAACGVDVAAARREGTLVSLDADPAGPAADPRGPGRPGRPSTPRSAPRSWPPAEAPGPVRVYGEIVAAAVGGRSRQRRPGAGRVLERAGPRDPVLAVLRLPAAVGREQPASRRGQ